MSSERPVYDLEHPEQLIIFIIRHQAALGIEARELETLLHLALHASSGQKTPFMVMEGIIATETAKTYRQVSNALKRLIEQGFILTRSPRKQDGSRMISFYDLAPTKSMIRKIEGWVQQDE